MKLQELAAPKPTKQIIKVFESYFGKSIRFDQLTAGQTQKLLTRVRGLLGETKRQPDIHYSERNPTYLKLMMMEQALTARLAEEMPVATAPGQPGADPEAAKQAADTIQATKDPAVKTALEKAAKGQNLTPDEQKLVAGAALMKTESKLRRAYRTLKESEV